MSANLDTIPSNCLQLICLHLEKNDLRSLSEVSKKMSKIQKGEKFLKMQIQSIEKKIHGLVRKPSGDLNPLLSVNVPLQDVKNMLNMVIKAFVSLELKRTSTGNAACMNLRQALDPEANKEQKAKYMALYEKNREEFKHAFNSFMPYYPNLAGLLTQESEIANEAELTREAAMMKIGKAKLTALYKKYSRFL